MKRFINVDTWIDKLKKVIDTISRNNGKILGVIVNNVESVKSHKYGKGYGYGYGYGYFEEDKEAMLKERSKRNRKK